MMNDKKWEEIEKDIDKMTLEELLYVRMAPQTYLNKVYNKELKETESLIQQIESNSENIKRNEEIVRNQQTTILNECNQLKSEIEASKDRINELLNEKSKLSKKPNKANFIYELDNEIKKSFTTPDVYFKQFLTKKINQDIFVEKLRECATGKNYYYYKILSDKLKEM